MKFRIILLLSTLLTIAIVHAVALEFFLYWKYLWLDIPMHIFGGVACALGFSILPFFNIVFPLKYTSYFGYIIFAFGIGISWEIFEVVANISLLEPGFVLDTSMDLCMDLVGASIGYGIVRNSNVMEL